MRHPTLLSLLLLCACQRCNEEKEPADTGPQDIDSPTDSAPSDTGESGQPGAGLSLSFELRDGSAGTLIVQLTQAIEDATTQTWSLQTGEDLELPDLPAGDYGLLAWLDEDGDQSWDGIWEGEGEPTARMGVTVPRDPLLVALRRGVPEPILDEDPEQVELYHAAWELAQSHIAAGTTDNGFADHYMDEAFSEHIFQWDTCFMTLFGHYGLDAFPVMGSLDNFYGAQQSDGYICRVVRESDGQPEGDGSDVSEPMINPPLFAWSELRYVQRSGDRSRLPRVLPVLAAYAAWLDEHVRTGPGLYYTSMLGSGMDNAPRDAAYDGWVDQTAQQALARSAMATLYELLGDEASAEQQRAEAERICGDIEDLMWDEDEGFYFDLDAESAPLADKTLASVWPLVAGCASDERAARVIDHLQDPSEFWRVHVFPSTAADSSYYDPYGYYWRGGVWAPTTYASVQALTEYGRRDLARSAAENHIRNLLQVYTDFAPDDDDLAKDHEGQGTQTLWELYAPDHVRPGTRWDATWLGRQDFVGWTGIGPIALLLEQVIGLQPDAPQDTLTWHLQRSDAHGVRGYRFGDQLADLQVEARGSASEPATIRIDSSDAFTLVVESAGRSWSFDVPAGESSFEADPSESALAAELLPAGPFPGYAVLGNGSISAVYSDDDGSGDPPGISHLYRGDFGTDLLELGQTLVGQDGARISQRSVGMDPFFAAYSEVPLPDGGLVAWRAFVAEPDAVQLRGVLAAGDQASSATLAPLVQLRESPHIDGGVSIAELGLDKGRNALWAELSDGTALALGCDPPPVRWQTGWIHADPVAGGLTGAIEQGRQLVLQLDLQATEKEQVPFTWTVAAADNREQALTLLDQVLAAADPLADAETHWADWAPERLCSGERCAVAAANLYAARASSLAGQVPADLTGQFVTSERPQLYPRDALMTARAFHLAGHDEQAWEILRYWLSEDRELAQAGEWYARYDALGRAVDAGSGAAYDVPEWDSNGYLAVLAEYLGSDSLSASERQQLLDGLDFLADQQDEDGLWTEGGIIEWEGRLPATAMSNWAGLDAGARIAESWGESARAADYRAAAGMLRGGLLQLLIWDGVYLADERDDGLAYDTSLLFGPVWGFPADPVLDATYDWIMEEARAHGGGVRYFDGLDYGQDLFFFTTSATAQYAAALGEHWTSSELLDWMLAFSNRYGLAPERVYQDGSGAAEASPLSWCAAELAMGILALEDAEDLAGLPVVDGALSSAEYRPWGPCLLDHDGQADEQDDLVALCAARDGDDLYVGLRLAGPPGQASYAIYLAPEDGLGSEPTSEGGSWLSFRADASATPGAAARIQLAADGSCSAGAALGDGSYEKGKCAAATGELALEAVVDLTNLGLSGATQLIAVRESGGSETLLPTHGSLLSDGADETVLATFEVDASAVAQLLQPLTEDVITLSGDRAELGAWAGHALELFDDGLGQDALANDGVWTVTVELERGGSAAYKYLVGQPGDGSWEGVEFDGDDRELWVEDVDATGRVRIWDEFGVHGGVWVDP